MALSAPQYGDLVKFKEAISHFQDKIKLTSDPKAMLRDEENITELVQTMENYKKL